MFGRVMQIGQFSEKKNIVAKANWLNVYQTVSHFESNNKFQSCAFDSFEGLNFLKGPACLCVLYFVSVPRHKIFQTKHHPGEFRSHLFDMWVL